MEGRYEAPVPPGGHDGLPVVDLLLHLPADGLVHHLLVASGRRDELVPVRDQRRMAQQDPHGRGGAEIAAVGCGVFGETDGAVGRIDWPEIYCITLKAA